MLLIVIADVAAVVAGITLPSLPSLVVAAVTVALLSLGQDLKHLSVVKGVTGPLQF